MKRALDVAGALAGIAVLWPLAILIAIAIKLDTRGPALFVQKRVGRDERVFRCLKFRSMHLDTPERATHYSTAADVTCTGHVLRRTKLDELPQLFNVLAGDMSLVGPRPCLPTQAALIEARRRLAVFRVRPGITGLAQVNGIDMSEPKLLAQVDAEYVAQADTLFDLRLILASLPGLGRFRPRIGVHD
ncbi:MAG: sugar transferase [Hyphomicrobiaceae bacterium]